jgi:hypothetical protein
MLIKDFEEDGVKKRNESGDDTGLMKRRRSLGSLGCTSCSLM